MPQTIVPFIAYEDAAAAIEWLTQAFGFHEDETARMTGADGVIGHAEMDVGDGSVTFLSTPSRTTKARSGIARLAMPQLDGWTTLG